MRSFCLILVALTVCAQGLLGSPSLQIPLQGNYLLDSEVTLNLTANEMEQVQIAVYRIDPFRQFQPAEASSVAEWVSKLNLGRIKPVLTRTVRHPNPPGYATLDVPLGKLPAGAYVIEASAGNLRSRALILVTGMMIIARTVGSQTLIYVCNAENGAPIAGADVRVIAARDVSGHQQPHEWRLLTDRQGIALFTPGAEGIRSSWSILASAGKWQAYTRYQESADTIIVRGGGSEDAALWRFYLFTDLPIYQPGQTVNWKLIARWWDEGTYHTPANRSLRYSIIDPQNEQIGRGEIRLNSFGSAFGSVEIPEKASPGRYYLRLYDEQGREIRTLLLCRVGTLPPPLQVSLRANLIPGQTDQQGSRSPDSVQVLIQVTDRSGKPVSGAKVHARLYTNSSFSDAPDIQEVPWYLEGTSRYRLPGIVQWAYVEDSAQATTDVKGTATVTVSRKGGAFSGEYRIWVTAKTEQGGAGANFASILTPDHRGWAYITPAKTAYEPDEPVTLRLRTVGADYKPVAMRGTVRIRRVTNARAIWKTPWNTRVYDEEIARRLHELGVPLDRAGTELTDENVLSQPLHTNASGQASITWKPVQEGYYVVSWEQVGAPAPRRVIARHRFYVVKPGSETEIHAPAEVAPVEAYPAAGDVGPGQKLPVLVILQNPPRHVLLIEEGSHILQRHLLYVKRKVELVYLPLNERHTPVFTLNAIVVEDGQAFGFTWNVVVPPRQHHLKVQVQPDKDGFWVVRTTDERNRPLSADVSIALVNRASLSAVLPFPAPWFDGAGTALGQHIPVPPLPPGYPEDPRLYFALPAPIDTFHRFDTSYDAAPYVKIVRGYQVLPIPHDWRYRATEWVPRSPLPGSEIPKPPGLISEGKLSHPFRGYWEVSLPKGAPNQIDESTYAQLPYTRYVQQSLRDAVLAQLPDDGEVTPRTLFWLPRVVTDEKGTATFKLPSGAGKGGVWIVIACSEDSQFGWLLQAIVPR